MNKKIFSFILVMSVLAFCVNTLHAEVVAYRLVKTVSVYGETQDIPNGSKVYINFMKDKGYFFVCKQDGSRAGSPDASTGYASGFANYDMSGVSNGVYGRLPVRDPLDFVKKGTENGIHIYSATRPLLATNFSDRSKYVSGYATDYVKFNSDYTRFNVIIDSEKGADGIYPFISLLGYDVRTVNTFVFQKVEKPRIDGPIY